MHPVIVIAGKDLRQRVRDRSALVLGFIAPLLIAALMSLAFRTSQSFHIDAGYVDLDHGPVAASLAQTMRSPDLARVITLHPYRTPEAARRAVDANTVKAAIVLPAGFSASIEGDTPLAVTVLGSANEPLSAQVCEAVTRSFVAQVNADRLSIGTAIAAGVPHARRADLTAQAIRLRLPEQVRQTGITDRPLKTISYYAPAMGIFFVLFAVGFGARGYFLERQAGTLDRIQAAPIGPGLVLAGKSLSTFVYALTSLAVMAIGSTLAFGADWGNPFAVGALCVAMAVATVTLTAFVTALARTERQADGLASIVVFGLTLLGGNFVFISAAPPLLRRLALATPNGWALRGFTDLGTGARGLGVVAQPVAAILAFSAVVTLVTIPLTRLRRGS